MQTDYKQDSLFPIKPAVFSSDDWTTPQHVFDALQIYFDLDPACPVDGPRFTPCKSFFSSQHDGLQSDWHGTVFINPPFSKAQPWMQRFLEHGDGIALTLVSKSRWCDKLFSQADAMLLLPSTFRFVEGSIFLPCALWALGQSNADALTHSGLGCVR